MSVEEKILKIISSETRRKIIKELSNGSRTPSDLSRILSKNKSTIVEHLDKLVEAGLVEKTEKPGKKWVFYSLSKEGESITSTRPSTKIVIVLSMIFLCLIGGSFSMYRYLMYRYFPLVFTQKDMAEAGGVTVPIAEKGIRGLLLVGNPVYLYIAIVLFTISLIGILTLLVLKYRKMWRYEI